MPHPTPRNFSKRRLPAKIRLQQSVYPVGYRAEVIESLGHVGGDEGRGAYIRHGENGVVAVDEAHLGFVGVHVVQAGQEAFAFLYAAQKVRVNAHVGR